MAKTQHAYIDVKQKSRRFYLTKMTAAKLTAVTYASVRGDSEEAGAVQRFLNPRRIAGVKNFALEGGDYPSCIVLNWVSKTSPLKIADGKLELGDEPRSAQIIDGQHRVAGLREAIKADKKIASVEIPVALYQNLDTSACADIFLAINTEQKPVPKSLVFDLYGVSSEHLVDHAALRAKDIASALNERTSSPYFGLIKFPGSSRMRGGIALSTVVSALKPLIEDKGALEQVGIEELERQTMVLLNLFLALKEKYGDEWESNDNPFLYASGFIGALQLFRTKLIDFCSRQKSFKKETISKALKLTPAQLLRQSEVRGQSGSSATTMIYDRLLEVFDPGHQSASDIEI